MTGGDGNDFYYVRDDGDLVSESNATASTGGVDKVCSYLLSYGLGSNVENGQIMATGTANLTGNTLNNALYAGIGANVIDGGAGSDTVSYYYGVSSTGVTASLASTVAQTTGGSGTDTLIGIENLSGSKFADDLTGNEGANVLSGKEGNDTLHGGGGQDIFVFNTKLNASSNFDLIADFNVIDDTIRLENTGTGVFNVLLTTGSLAVGAFNSGVGMTRATETDDRIIYNKTTGTLYYDADGSGTASSAIAFAILGTIVHPELTALDFVVV